MKRLLIFLVCFVTGVAMAQGGYDTISYDPEGFHALVAKFKKEQVAKGRVVFFGDNLIAGVDWKRIIKDTTILSRGISGDITFGLLYRVDEVSQRMPSKVFILIGVNDISKGIPDEVIMENIFSVVGRIRSKSPKTQVFVQSLLPTSNAFPNFPKHKNKDDHMVIINGQLQKYADKLHFTYIDLYTKFLDKESRLDVKYTTDGLHLNQSGYALWVSILKELKYL